MNVQGTPLLFHICRGDCEARGGGAQPARAAPPPPASQLFEHLFRMSVHSFHKGAHVLRVHVGVKAVAQVGDVALRAEALQHLLHDVGNALLEEGRGQRSGKVLLAYPSRRFRVPQILPSLVDLCRNNQSRRGRGPSF